MRSQLRVAGRWAAMAAIFMLVAACDDTTAPTPPDTPANFQVTQLTLTSVRASWDAVTDASEYVLERADANNPGTFSAVGGTITESTYDDTGLTEGLHYSYRVKAVNGGLESEYSQTVSIATGVKAATLSGNLTANRTLTEDTVYTLSGYVKVTSGATLTIQPGTRIVGDTTVPGSSLWIRRGAKIMAVGTADDPIVFTSARAAGSRAPGDWGGIIIVGNGIINRTGTTILTEGPANVAENYAGGTDNGDNSGQLKYVRIEFAGYDVSNGAGQELNGISAYAVGGGTRYEYVQVLAGLDDSFEFWGGAVQGRYLVSYESGDDHFDWSEGYVGKLQYLVAFQSQKLTPRPGTGTFSSDPRGFEADGCDPAVSGCTLSSTRASEPYSNPTIANFTLVGTGQLGGYATDGNGIVLRRGTAGWLQNGIIARFKGVGLNLRDAWTDSLRLRDLLAVKNVILAENGQNYDTNPAHYGQEAKFATSSHRTAATAVELFVFNGLNPASLDWTPAGAGTTGGADLPVARAAGFFGGTMDNTAYVGAANPAGPKWWQGWTVYAIN